VLEHAAGVVVHLRHVDAAAGKLLARRLDVVDDQIQTLR